jgi:prevent-host-death family protein
MTIVMTMVKALVERRMSISEFRAKCLALMDEVEKTGVPIVVTKRGVPIGRLEPATAEQQRLYYEGKLEEWKPSTEKKRVKASSRR